MTKSISNALLLLALASILFWAPLPLGSNRQVFVAILALATGLALVLWAGLAVAGLVRVHRHAAVLLWPAAALMVVSALAILQMQDLRVIDAALGTTFARDWAHPIWSLAANALETPFPASISLNPDLTLVALIKTLTYAGVFFLAFQLSQDAGTARRLLLICASIGAVYTFVGFVQIGLRTHFGGWIAGESAVVASDVHSLGRFNSTFVNANNFATMAGISLIAAFALTYEDLRTGVVLGRGQSVAWRTALNTVTGSALPGLAAILLLTSAVLFSGSRGGTIAMLLGCVALVGGLGAFNLSESGQSRSNLHGYLLGGIIIFALAISSGTVFSRLTGSSVQETTRQDIAIATVDAALASPVVGNGYGAFISYYPLYAQRAIPGTVDKAHNDYVEVLADLGFFGAAMLFFMPLYLMTICAAGCWRRSRGKYFPAAGLAAGVLCAVHATVDFSLQIPAVGILLYAILGVGVAQSWSEQRS